MAGSTELKQIVTLTVPRWGMSMEEGTLLNWLVNEGDMVHEGDEVAELESSKIVNALQAHASGILRRRLAGEGDTLPTGALLGIIAKPDVPDSDIDSFIANFIPDATAITSADTATAYANSGNPERSSVAVPPAPAGADESVPDQLKIGPDDRDVPASPHARRLAKKMGINLNNIRSNDHGRRIQVEDIERVVRKQRSIFKDEQPENATVNGDPAATGAEIVNELPLSGTRQIIASRVKAAKLDAPHFRLVADVCVDGLLELRRELNSSATSPGITINDMLVRICALALMEEPGCNVQFDGRVVRQHRNADISVAIALPDGVITPVVAAANLKRIDQIADEIKILSERARAGGLRPEEYTGGTFTISNLGMHGVRQFDAILNSPQVMILAVGSAEQRVVVRAGSPAVATVMTLTVSCDHRVIDGVLGARFLQVLTDFIENPGRALS